MSGASGGARVEVRCLTDIRVVDGDTIRCRAGGHETTVRLYGIDAPELEQLGGPDAADALESIIRGSEPLLMEVIDVDLYERDVGLLYARRSHRRDSVNIRMVREGYAYAFTRFGGREMGFRAAQHDARAARRGVWTGSRAGGERPWNYRRRVRERPVSGSLLLSLLMGTNVGRIVLAVMITVLLIGAVLVERCGF